jgi:hypothetical protein
MRSKAPPPMSARVAMQFRRDGAKRSLKTGAAKLSKACARGGWGWNLLRTAARKQCKKLRAALSIALLNSGDVNGYIACVLSGLAGMVFERSTTTSRAVIRWRWKLRAPGI